jgi:microcystin-dependent protein
MNAQRIILDSGESGSRNSNTRSSSSVPLAIGAPMSIIGESDQMTSDGMRYNNSGEKKSRDFKKSALMIFVLFAMLFCVVTSVFIWKSGLLSKDLFKSSGNANALTTTDSNGAPTFGNNTSSSAEINELRALVANLTAQLSQMNEKTSQELSRLTQKSTKAELDIQLLNTKTNSTDALVSIVNGKVAILNGNVTSIQSVLNAFQLSLVPVGSIHWFPTTNVPAGFLKLNGAILSRSSYANLWNYALNSGNLASSEGVKSQGQFGPGDGSSSFSLPDLRGVFVRSWADNGALDAGRTVGSFQDHQNLAHSHGVTDSGHSHSVNDPGHAHGINDPGHAHQYSAVSQVNMRVAGGVASQAVDSISTSAWGTAGSGTGISIFASGTGIWLSSSNAGISIQNQGGSEVRVKNVALLACIKF